MASEPYAIEGAKPLSLDNIPDVTVTNAHETALVHDDTLLTALDETPSIEDITPSGMNTDETVASNTSTNVCKALSIPMEIPTLSFDGISKDVFKQLQTHDNSLQPLWDQAHKGNKIFFIIDSLLMCLTSTLNTVSHALVVPQQLRKKVLIAAHDGLGHGGINTTRSLLNKHFTWPGLADDVRKHVQACQKCLKHTKSGGQKVPMMQPELICHRGEKLVVDIVGPLPILKMKFRFIFTCMELATGYPFAVPLRSYTSEETAKAILSVIAIVGAPIIILSDQGSNFLSITLTHLYKKVGISRIKTSAYHPHSNGKLERFHSTMKSMISKCISEKPDWPVALDLVLYFCRNMPHSRHGFTPQELHF